MKLSFRQRLFLYFSLLFTVFTVGIAFMERSGETAAKREAMEEKLDVYVRIIQSELADGSASDISLIGGGRSVLPDELRITLIDKAGNVSYDNTIADFSKLGNHLNRAEIIQAEAAGKGSDIRESASNHLPYLYYAKRTADGYVRVALPYNPQLRQFLKADNLFLYFLLSLFLVSIFFIHKITQQFGASIRRLRDFALHPSENRINFSDDELGEIGKRITENYKLLENHKKSLSIEKQKLLQHIQISEEGICFISPDREIEFHNGLFIQYLNQLTEEPKSDPGALFADRIFEPLQNFFDNGDERYFESRIHSHGKIFSVRANKFDDSSAEVILTDISRAEKTKKLKQEMTGNIAHELRTPVTSVRAYLETVLGASLPDDKKQHFIQQAYNQTLSLSEMIKDMSIIAKMEEAPDSFGLEKVNLYSLVENIRREETANLAKKNIRFSLEIDPELSISGNPSLLNSIFRNLIENSIRYAGENIEIKITMFSSDDEYYYFSYWDSGIGISDENHLNRVFERFYRIQEGRTRDSGGSGLGLSIVKNAVLFHRGNITARNRKEGGLEFLFQLHK